MGPITRNPLTPGKSTVTITMLGSNDPLVLYNISDIQIGPEFVIFMFITRHRRFIRTALIVEFTQSRPE